MLADTRARSPHLVTQAAARRRRRSLLDDRGRLLLIAADHPARGAFAVGARPTAMASRIDLLDRLLVALARRGVDGVLGTPDVIEDLLLLGALDGKVVTCSMNRGGLPGSAFELDDRFTAYDAATIAAMGFDGGKMLLRIDPAEPATADTLAGCARAVNELADHRLMAMVEPFWAHRSPDGRSRNDLDPHQMMRAVAVAQALGRTSAYTWLKVPVVADMARVMEATTLPTVLLGGDPTGDPEDTYQAWAKALELPNVYGLTVGRTVLYPPDDDVAAAVDAAAALL
jgi:DhnA family fructose-bisphosphate aldolase class Ia